MKTTFFKPSIHGWPFNNSFSCTISFLFGLVTHKLEGVGFCGGMCWTALDRYYKAVQIPRDTQKPSEGDVLHSEIYASQINSLPNFTILKIYDWQQRPDQGHWNRAHSLGHLTQEEWVNVKDHLNSGHPVTLTLITSSNNYNVADLKNNHRVVAYGYDERPLMENEWVHGDKRENVTAVTIFIYDPNYPDDDDVYLTFYTGCEDSWIGMKHNQRDNPVHGFFLDDYPRNFAFSSQTMVEIEQCKLLNISSRELMDYELTFSWQSNIIPFFCVQVNGLNWNKNEFLKKNILPANMNNKQCSTRAGKLTLNLSLPRQEETVIVAIRFLDNDDFTRTIQVDTKPTIFCYPYARKRSPDKDCFQICDTGIADSDLYIKNSAPSDDQIQQLDTSPDRWIYRVGQGYIDKRSPQGQPFTTHVETFDTTVLGNLKTPILCNFVKQNLAEPVTLSGSVKVKIIQSGSVVQNNTFSSLSQSGQKIFNGFKNNPADYDADKLVEFNYRARDNFGVIVQGKATFYSQSIIHTSYAVVTSILDVSKIALAEVILHDLIAKGLIDYGLGLHVPPPPPEPPIDPLVLMNKLCSNPQMERLIKQTIKSTWNDKKTWIDIWTIQEKILTQPDPIPRELFTSPTQQGKAIKKFKEIHVMWQNTFDAVIFNTIAQKAIGNISKNAVFVKYIKELWRK